MKGKHNMINTINAMNKLTKEKTLTTEMLKPLNITFETFLRFTQLAKKDQDFLIDKLIKYFNK